MVAGRTGQEYNLRKKRKGAFWEGRYHATAIESEQHLLRCLVYIDLNMVRNGVVSHPSEWPFGGYNEIQNPRKKCAIIAYKKLTELAGFGPTPTGLTARLGRPLGRCRLGRLAADWLDPSGGSTGGSEKNGLRLLIP